MVEQGLIDWKTAVRRIPADQVDQLLTPIFDREAIKSARVLTRGLPAGRRRHRTHLPERGTLCGSRGQR